MVDERWSAAGLASLRDLYEPLRRFAGVIGRWDVDPDDLVQEAYENVLRRREAEIRDLGPYLRRTIANLATSERRRARRRTDLTYRIGGESPMGDSYPSELADLMRLSPRVRGLLYLVEVERHPIADAADMVDMTATAARVALVRARRQLRRELNVELSGE